MNRFYYLLTLGIIFLTLSCNNQDLEQSLPNDDSHFISLVATVPDFDEEDETRASASSTIKPSWTKGDEVAVVNLTKQCCLAGKLTADGSGSATFSGSLEGTIEPNDMLAFIYPAQEFVKNAPFSSLMLNVANIQDGKNPPLHAVATYQVPSSINLQKIVCNFFFYISYYKLNIAGLPINSEISKIEIPGMGSSAVVPIVSNKFNVLTATITDSNFELNNVGTTSDQGYIALKFTSVGANAQTNPREIRVTCAGKTYVSSMVKSAYYLSTYRNVIVSAFQPEGGKNEIAIGGTTSSGWD